MTPSAAQTTVAGLFFFFAAVCLFAAGVVIADSIKAYRKPPKGLELFGFAAYVFVGIACGAAGYAFLPL